MKPPANSSPSHAYLNAFRLSLTTCSQQASHETVDNFCFGLSPPFPHERSATRPTHIPLPFSFDFSSSLKRTVLRLRHRPRHIARAFSRAYPISKRARAKLPSKSCVAAFSDPSANPSRNRGKGSRTENFFFFSNSPPFSSSLLYFYAMSNELPPPAPPLSATEEAGPSASRGVGPIPTASPSPAPWADVDTVFTATKVRGERRHR